MSCDFILKLYISVSDIMIPLTDALTRSETGSELSKDLPGLLQPLSHNTHRLKGTVRLSAIIDSGLIHKIR